MITRGRYSGLGFPSNWIITDIVRVEDGVFVEHWDVIQDEATKEQSKSGHPMFAEAFAEEEIVVTLSRKLSWSHFRSRCLIFTLLLCSPDHGYPWIFDHCSRWVSREEIDLLHWAKTHGRPRPSQRSRPLPSGRKMQPTAYSKS